MALTRLQRENLDRWIQNGHSWDDPDDYYDPDDDEYSYLDEDDCDNDPRYDDMRCFPEDYRDDE